MEVVIWVLVAIAVLAVLAAIWFFLQNRRTEHLQRGFGPEYERAVHETGDRRAAESELHERERRVSKLHVRPLSSEERSRFAAQWEQTQARFVDDPDATIDDADRLVGAVMQARGYPVGEFEQRAADISVDHPTVVSNYRAAHRIALDHERGDSNTEDLRQGIVHYRALFDDLLQEDRVEEETRR